ncbi:restriction endonuclease subunit S [Vibrio alginolyticus]
MSNNDSFEILHWEKNFGKPIESWTYLPIEKLIKERKDSRVNDGSLKLCSLTIEDGVVEKTERYNREFLLKNQEDNKYKCVHPNDIVINPMNLRFGAIAKSKHPKPVLVSGYYNVVSASKLVDTDYLNAFLKSTAMNYMYERVALGTLNEKKRVHLSELKKIVVPIPTIKEQLKIGQILSTWDKAISTTEKLIETNKQQKKALMQQLLTGKKRLVNPEKGKAFEGEWERYSMSDLVSIDRKSLGKKTADDFKFQYISLSDVDVGSISDELEVHLFASAPSRARRVIQEGDILLSTVRPNLKGFAKVSGKHADCIASTGFSVLTPKKRVSGDYIYQYIFSSHVTGQIDSLVVGSNYPAINSSDVAGLKVYCPTYEEQQKIASVLTAADKEIEVLEAKLAHFKQEKKALMQQLLTGNRRVKVDEDVVA